LGGSYRLRGTVSKSKRSGITGNRDFCLERLVHRTSEFFYLDGRNAREKNRLSLNELPYYNIENAK